MRTMWRKDMLVQQGMPRDEIRAILAARDGVVVRRHLELHRERLDEEYALQRRVLERIEECLAARAATYERADACRAVLVQGLRR